MSSARPPPPWQHGAALLADGAGGLCNPGWSDSGLAGKPISNRSQQPAQLFAKTCRPGPHRAVGPVLRPAGLVNTISFSGGQATLLAGYSDIAGCRDRLFPEPAGGVGVSVTVSCEISDPGWLRARRIPPQSNSAPRPPPLQRTGPSLPARDFKMFYVWRGYPISPLTLPFSHSPGVYEVKMILL